MPILSESEIMHHIADPDDGPVMDERKAVEVAYLDGWLPPRRCCATGCRDTAIVGPPLVSEGLPYHADCYLKSRRLILGVAS